MDHPQKNVLSPKPHILHVNGVWYSFGQRSLKTTHGSAPRGPRCAAPRGPCGTVPWGPMAPSLEVRGAALLEAPGR